MVSSTEGLILEATPNLTPVTLSLNSRENTCQALDAVRRYQIG